MLRVFYYISPFKSTSNIVYIEAAAYTSAHIFTKFFASLRTANEKMCSGGSKNNLCCCASVKEGSSCYERKSKYTVCNMKDKQNVNLRKKRKIYLFGESTLSSLNKIFSFRFKKAFNRFIYWREKSSHVTNLSMKRAQKYFSFCMCATSHKFHAASIIQALHKLNTFTVINKQY